MVDRRRRALCAVGAGLAVGVWPSGCRRPAKLNASASSAAGAPLSFEMVSGQSREHVDDGALPLHPQTAAAFERLRAAAAKEDIDLRAISAFRSFDRQLRIWNEKASGQRPVYDDAGAALRIKALAPAARVHAILRWSALPGGSRHHWGADVDVYDAAAVPEGYRVRLDEREAYIVFARLHRWLDEHLPRVAGQGFYRPYDGRGGIGAEPWHLSWRPLAVRCQTLLRPKALRALIQSSEIELKSEILADFDDIYRDYIATYFIET